MMLQEQYPDLKANEQFSMLQAQLEGTENRINEARKKYNESVRDYNVSVRRFPINILAGMFGFEKRATFEATADAQNAPSVNF
jgi:lemA protein